MVGWSVGTGTGVRPLRTGPLGLAYSTAPLILAAYTPISSISSSFFV